ncbi:hypothetical protein BH10BAC1_BH10BAC1_08410 [soil metagenome]
MRKIIKKGAIVSLLLLFSYSIKCQTTFNIRVDLNNESNLSNKILYIDDTIYIGTTNYDTTGLDWWKPAILKMDVFGNLIEQKIFYDDSLEAGEFGDLILHNNSIYYSTIRSSTTPNISSTICKITKGLDTIFNHFVSDTSNYTFCHSIKRLKDKIVLFSITDSTCGIKGNGNYMPELIFVDTLGNILSKKILLTSCKLRNSWTLDSTKSSGFILCGFEKTVMGGTTFLIKTDSVGVLLWQKYYGNITTGFPSVVASKSYGYLVATNQIDSTYLSSFYWTSMKLYRLDESGDTIWTKKIGVKSKGFSPTSIKQLTNYDFIISGVRTIPHYDISGSIVSEQLYGFLCRIDSSGNVKWFNDYTGNFTNDSAAQNSLYDVVQTSDGGFIAVGDVAPTDGTTQDTWVIKVDSMGCLVPGCNGTLGVTSINIDDMEFSIYPNPANDIITIETNFKNCYFSIYDLTGKLILEEKINQNKTQISLTDYSSGLYFIQLHGDNRMISKKFIKQ